MKQSAIGVFDSGIGGITAVRELKRIMPHENIIYFGDTARVPYGNRGRKTIERYAAQDIRFLLSQHVKIIVAACGTVTSNPPTKLIQTLPVDYLAVLQPAVWAACRATRNKKIGVIATSASIKSHAYPEAIRTLLPDAEIVCTPCPLFVPLVENGYIDDDNPVTEMVAKEYLSPLKAAGVDTLILGCTHYPLIEGIIGKVMGGNVSLISPGAEAANHVRTLLHEKGLENTSGKPGVCSYFVSDDTETFAENAEIFLNDDISGNVQKISIEDYDSI